MVSKFLKNIIYDKKKSILNSGTELLHFKNPFLVWPSKSSSCVKPWRCIRFKCYWSAAKHGRCIRFVNTAISVWQCVADARRFFKSTLRSIT